MLFINTPSPTPYAIFDADAQFQSDADSVVVFVKRKLGDDVISVELTKKMIWACFEEATLEYGAIVNQSNVQSQLANILGFDTGSGVNLSYVYPRETLEFLMRQTEPYSTYAGVGGSFDSTLGYIDLEDGRQDYNIYSELRHSTGSFAGNSIYESLPSGSQTKLRVLEIFHFSPLAAQHYLLNASNVTNYLATEFNYESYVNSTVFYVLPVFEDVLRRGMLEEAYKIRRSNYSYQIIGSNLRLYPIPTSRYALGKLYIRVMAGMMNPFGASVSGSLGPTYNDSTIYGVSNIANAPYGNLIYNRINAIGHQWIRQYTFALCMELCGIVRSKVKTINIPGAELQLNGDDLVRMGREDKEKMKTDLRALLETLTYDKLAERNALKTENLIKQLKAVPMPMGKAVYIY